MSEREQVKVFDTTLRDGEQSSGCSMNGDEKLRMARQLDRLGVDVIEAGFPIAPDGEFRAVEAVALSARGDSDGQPHPDGAVPAKSRKASELPAPDVTVAQTPFSESAVRQSTTGDEDARRAPALTPSEPDTEQEDYLWGV